MSAELIERIEKATEDDLPQIAFGVFELLEATPDQREKIAGARERVSRGELDAADIMNWRSFDESVSRRAVHSVDAALSLVSRVRGGANISIEISETMMDGRVFHPTDVTIYGRAFSHEPDTHAHADEPALAICLALLRAIYTESPAE